MIDDEISAENAGPEHWMIYWQDDSMPAPRHRYFRSEATARSTARSHVTYSASACSCVYRPRGGRAYSYFHEGGSVVVVFY